MDRKSKQYRITRIGIAAAIALIAVFGLIACADGNEHNEDGTFQVYINEVLTSNDSYPNGDGVCCDFIELYNDSDSKVSLDGWQLGDKKSGDRYVIPEGTAIDPHGYLLISCSKDRSGANYAAFGLSKNGGEDLYFMDPNSVVIDMVKTIAAEKDVSQGYDETHTWRLLSYVTPGCANTREGYLNWQENRTLTFSSDIQISEIMTSNSVYRTVGEECTDWIELYNASGAPVRLDGYGLSDSAAEPIWFFPDNTILEAGAYLVVPCAQMEENTARFGLSKAGGENVTLFGADGTVADMIRTVPAEQNQAYARMPDGSWSLTFHATPGFANTPEGRAAYILSTDPQNADVHITEIMADNKSVFADATGAFHDWIELTNTGDADCDLSGWFLSDDADDPTQWRIPDCMLKAGESAVIFFAGNRDGVIDGQLFAPMGLSAAGDAVYLSDPLGGLRETVVFCPMEENRSLVIDPETGAQTVCAYPTPGFIDTAQGYEAFAAQQKPIGALAVWEVMSANDAYLPQSGEYYDWVEFKNVSSEPIDLSAYSVSDEFKKPDRYVLPQKTLAPGEIYVIILSGHSEYSNKQYEHAGWKLNAVEDDLFLFENGKLIDYVHVFGIPYRYTLGRYGDEGGFFYMEPTPGEENRKGYRMVSDEPVASVSSGVYNGVTGIDVTLDGNGTIYYTTDCSDPDELSNVYTGPIRLDHTTILRSVCVEPEKKESSILTCSYLINETHDLPVVSLVTDPWHLWDANDGIYIDGTTRKEIEYPASAAYFGPDGVWAKTCGIKMHGLTSLIASPKKSFTLKFSGVYGGPLHFDLFGDGEVTAFKSVILRADSESVYASFLRDNLLHKLAKRYSTAMLAQNTRYAVLYLNGEYWGIYSIREQYTPFFYASNLGVPEDTVSIAKNYIRGGTGLAEVQSYTKNHSMTEPDHYAYVAERIDVDSLIDWAIFEAYCDNFDMGGNMRFLYSSVDGKWRWGLVDVDLGFSMNRCFTNVLDEPQVGMMLRKLFQNETFKKKFMTRLAELLKGGLSDENVTALIDEMAGEIRSEIPNEIRRWGGPKNWETMVKTLKDYVDGRTLAMITGAKKTFGLTDEEFAAYFGALVP